MFRKRSVRLLNGVCTFKLCLVSRWIFLWNFLKTFQKTCFNSGNLKLSATSQIATTAITTTHLIKSSYDKNNRQIRIFNLIKVVDYSIRARVVDLIINFVGYKQTGNQSYRNLQKFQVKTTPWIFQYFSNLTKFDLNYIN